MSIRLRRFLIGLTVVLALGVGLYVGMWMWLLGMRNPLDHPLAQWPVWPVACSWRGCVRSDGWLFYQQQAEAFAAATDSQVPDAAASLTTATRYHLLRQEFIKAPVTISDAKRYRETVLRIPDDSPLLTDSGFTASEYDSTVILPFLLQEALRQQYRVETTDELYRLLERERTLVVLPWQFRWDQTAAAVRAD